MKSEENEMKFFTPELIAMGQSTEDSLLNEQERLWDEAGDRYVTHLDTIRSRFPVGLRQMDNNYYLHDSVIRGMGQRDLTFVIVLQLDTPPRSLLTFTYDLIDPPTITKGVLPPQLCGAGQVVDWQYDEMEMVPGDPLTWRQSILLSNGWEVRLHFNDAEVQEVQALIPVSASLNGHVTVADSGRVVIG
jgi:hypothetical protein